MKVIVFVRFIFLKYLHGYLEHYSKEIEEQMQELYSRLSEKNRRLYAGIEALKLPYGGVSYIARIFAGSRDTVWRGIKELKEPETVLQNRERQVGGGGKPLLDKPRDIDEVFLLILKEHTAGDPINEKVSLPNLTSFEIAVLLSKEGFKVSRNIVLK
ncbi:MAG TPA: hypothetical protein ENG03_10375 [Thioploca sp.]|nr:hypothetical protein [Thioploca sp.]